MINQSRRNLLKGMGYGLAVSVVGVTSTVMTMANSASKDNALTANSSTSAKDISIFQQKNGDKEIVTLMNLADAPVTLDHLQPVNIETINSSIMVKVNTVSSDTSLVMLPGERLTFEVEKVRMESANKQSLLPDLTVEHLKLSSEHYAFNQKIPVSVFGAVA